MNTISRPLLIAVLVGFVGFIAVSCNRSHVSAANEDNSLNNQKILSMDDQAFLVGAEKSMIRQNTLAEKALAKSRDAAVVEFAHAVIHNNTNFLPDVQQLMKEKHIQEPAPFVEDSQMDAANLLGNLSGKDLNDKFISLITAEQQQELRSFDSAAETAGDADVRAFARKLLPTLQQEQDRLVQIQKNLAEPPAEK